MKFAIGIVFAVLWTFTDGLSIVVTPPNNQTVPINIDVNVTYGCIVDEGRLAEWEFNNIQIPTGSTLVNTLSQAGIFIENVASNETVITVTRSGRETFSNRDLKISCTALSQNTDALDINFGPVNYVRTFDIPNIPHSFDFNPFPGNASRLVLTWGEPNNTLFDTGDPVVTTYLVTVSGPTINFTRSTIERRVEFVDSVTSDCAMHDFTVSASNEAGQGMSVTINATIPISPDIEALNNSLAVSSIDLRSGVAVEVSFQPATTCSQDFAILHYMVSVVGGASVTYLVTDQRIQDQEVITLPVPSSGLQQNEVYSVFVSACISVTCRHSIPVQFMTTDVQSARVTFFENNILLDCTFATQSSAAGCVFIFTVSENDTETFKVPIAEQTQCTTSANMQNAYPSIVVVDWKADMSLGPLEIPVVTNPEFTDAVNFTQATGCVPIVPSSLSPGAIVGIVIGVLFAVALILIVVIVVAIVCYYQKTKKLPKIMSGENEKMLMSFDKSWLMDKPIKKPSLKRGRSAIDGSGNVSEAKTLDAAKSPTTPESSYQPASLTLPEAAFRLHISRDEKKASLHLNRALIRQVLKEKRMRTLERKAGRPKLKNQSTQDREILLPLHSEIYVTGEGSDDDNPDARSDDIEGEESHIISEL